MKLLTDTGLSRVASRIKNDRTLLDMPKGEILWLSPKGCTTASIKEAGGVVDISGREHPTAATSVNEIRINSQVGPYIYTSTPTLSKRIHIDKLSTLGLTTDSTYTFCLTFIIDSITTTTDTSVNSGLIWNNCNSWNGGNEVALWINRSGEIALTRGRDGLTYTAGGHAIDRTIVPATDLILHRPYHLVMVFSTSDTKLYLDGKILSENNGNFINFNISLNHWILGCWTNTNPLNWTGGVADYRIYPYALTPTQVKTLYMASTQPIARYEANMIKDYDKSATKINSMATSIFS